MKLILFLMALMMPFKFIPADKLTGRWESKPSQKGNITGVTFSADSKLEGYINRKPFVSGVYTLKNDLISFTDNGCNGALAVYKIYFFSNEDSLRFEVVSDSCTERKNGMTRLILGRVKE